jgi:hypothetical protein
MGLINETEVIRACQTLFGREIDITPDFLFYSVQPAGVKAAYRKKAKETHPDLFASDPLHVQKTQTALFREILRAYDVMNLFLTQREQGVWRPRPAGRRPGKQEAPRGKPASGPPPSGKHNDIYYNGPAPKRHLQIGQFLYYRGKISFSSLVSALLWQRKQRPTVGDIALQWRLLNADQISSIFSRCCRARLFGERAVELGLLSAFQLNTILLYQRSRQERLGRYFVQQHILSAGELESLARELTTHNSAVPTRATGKSNRDRVYA